MSLRIVVGCVSLLTALTAWNGLRMYRQHSAVQGIVPLGWTILARLNSPAGLQNGILPNEVQLGILLGDVVAVYADETAAQSDDVQWTYGRSRCTNLIPHSTDAGLDSVELLTSLEVLSLDGLQITDAGLAHLRGLSRLRKLSLANTPISDDALTHLHGLTRLQTLSLAGTKTTKRGIEELQRSLPALKVTR